MAGSRTSDVRGAQGARSVSHRRLRRDRRLVPRRRNTAGRPAARLHGSARAFRRARVIRRTAMFLAALTAIAVFAPMLAPYEAGEAFREYLHAPPMRPHFNGASPVVHPLVLADRLEQRFEPDRSRTVR